MDMGLFSFPQLENCRRVFYPSFEIGLCVFGRTNSLHSRRTHVVSQETGAAGQKFVRELLLRLPKVEKRGGECMR